LGDPLQTMREGFDGSRDAIDPPGIGRNRPAM